MNLFDLNRYQQHLNNYSELRLQENRILAIQMLKGNLTLNKSINTKGISCRTNKSGCWGFASSSNYSDETIKQVITKANENANFLSSKNSLDISLKHKTGINTSTFFTQKNKYSQKCILDYIKSLDNYIENKYPRLHSRFIELLRYDIEKKIITTDSSHSYSMIPQTSLQIKFTVESKDGLVQLLDVASWPYEIEDSICNPSDMHFMIDQLYENLMKKKEGIMPEAGIYDVIMGSGVTGLLAHEAIGHPCEADQVIAGSIAGEFINKKVASELVSITDIANTYNNETCPVPVYIDDEGTDAKDVSIIKDGILKELMHNSETAGHFNSTSSGNARASCFFDEPIVRMRNTIIHPGQDSLNDMISSVDHGYYLVDRWGGQADSTSEFMMDIPLAFEIINGKIGKALKDVKISGVAFDVLKSVTMVSSEFEWNSRGFCGKLGQGISVGKGGPSLKCKVNIGGK